MIWFVSCHDMVHFMLRYGPYGNAKKAVWHAGGVRTTIRRTAHGCGKPLFTFRTVAVDVVSFSVLRILSVRNFYFRDGIFMHPKPQQ